MKLRRRIGSVFLAFAMALSLIPSVAVSALAATAEGDNSLVTLEYENDGSAAKYTVNVSVYVDQAEEPVDSFTVTDANRTTNNMLSLGKTLNDAGIFFLEKNWVCVHTISLPSKCKS